MIFEELIQFPDPKCRAGFLSGGWEVLRATGCQRARALTVCVTAFCIFCLPLNLIDHLEGRADMGVTVIKHPSQQFNTHALCSVPCKCVHLISFINQVPLYFQ